MSIHTISINFCSYNNLPKLQSHVHGALPHFEKTSKPVVELKVHFFQNLHRNSLYIILMLTLYIISRSIVTDTFTCSWHAR